MTDLVTGDTGSKLRVTCKDVGLATPINLTDCTVKLRWDGASGIVTKTMTIVDAVNGVVEYQFLAGDIVYPTMKFEVEITDTGGFITSNLDLIELAVREQLG